MCCHAYTGGTGIKCSDEFTLPLCDTHHREFDSGKEKTIKKYGLNKAKLKAIMIKFRAEYKRINNDSYLREMREKF